MPPSQAHATPSSALSSVAERLRAIRRELDLTLSDVALRSGVSISNLSKIERADVSPSFDVVIRICEGSRRPIEHFVRPGPQSSVNGRKTTTLQSEVVAFASAQYDYLAHASEVSRKTMVPLEMWERARGADEFDHWSEHDGEEFIYVSIGEADANVLSVSFNPCLAERPPIEGFMNPATRQGNATASSCCQTGIAAWTSPPPHNSARACDHDVVIP